MELLLIRHALPVRVDNAEHGGPADPHLSERGVAQSEALADWLTDLPGERIDAVWSSPLRRAAETARPLVERLGLSPLVEEGLAEYDRHATSYIPIEELKAAGDPRWKEIPETPEEFRHHVIAAVDRIVDAHRSQRVAVVCHGGVVNAYAAHVLGLTETLFFLPAYTSISRVLAGADGLRSIASLNETAHVRHLL
jgi:2,3-bisphosphoglycerate-dependent phosphoglycerate mutase